MNKKIVEVDTTYTSGFSYEPYRNITKGDYVRLCELLTEELKIPVRPEGISEGGLFFKVPTGYKSIRMYIPGYPFVYENAMDEWRDSKDILIYKHNFSHKKISDYLFKKRINKGHPRHKEYNNTFLKAFYGAPVFTIDELEIIEYCFAEIGLIRKGKFPLKKNLVEKWKYDEDDLKNSQKRYE